LILSKTNLFIPQKIKVGYQNRDGTYTGKLAYVIYYDNKGKLRKEASWQSWRSKDIDPDDFDNAPTEGFVLNKKVGGYSNGWGDFRQAYVRVYDPRGFEFEITIPNLLYILEHTSSIKGKGLEGEFVYAWDGADLVLLPAMSPDYVELTKLNDQRFKNETIKAKDLKVGATYLHTDNVEWVYMGRFDYYDDGYECKDGKWFESYRKAISHCEKNDYFRREKRYWGYQDVPDYKGCVGNCGKRHYFYSRHSDCFKAPKSLSGLLIDILLEEPAHDYAELFEKLERITHYSPYDESRDEQLVATIEQVKEHIGNWYWGKRFKTNHGFLTIRSARDNDRPDAYLCSFDDDSYGEKLRRFFETIRKDSGFAWGSPRYDMIPVSLEEIFSKFEFYYTNEYLANGKFYRTVW